jgi:arginine decarboxylase-like protein
VEGDTSREVLAYVQYDAETLYGIMMRNCQMAIREERISPAESRALLASYKSQLDGYTYIG